MKGYANTFFILLMLTGLVPLSLSGQTRAELERQREQTREEIAYTEELIRETTEKYEATVSHLNLLVQQIQSREKLVESYRSEVQLLGNQIDNNLQVVNSLEEDLQMLQNEFAEMIRMAHRNNLGNNLVSFILAAESFQQAYKRVQFMRYYSERRQRQMELIEMTRETLNDKVAELKVQHEEQKKLINSVNKELQTLRENRESQAALINNLEGREEDLKRELDNKRATAERLNRAIENIIQREMEEARKRRAEEERLEVPEHEREDLQLSKAFEENKNKIPWPVERGFITQTFGKHEHPTIKGVYINNNGIDIQTNRGEKAKSVFNGDVARVINIPGANNAVILRHGEYFTVYYNLGEIFVSPGETIETGTPLGEIVSNPDSGETVLHFEVWENVNKMNPEDWLYSR